MVEPGAVEAALPIESLDRVLRPLRRVLAYASRDPQAAPVRYLEVNAGRWIASALRLDLPHAVRDLLAVISARLTGFDTSPGDEQRERVRAMYQALTRVDALLGLPLDVRVTRPVRAPAARPADRDLMTEEGYSFEPEPTVTEAEVAVDEAALDGSERGWRLGDPAHTGRSLAGLDLPAALVRGLAEDGVETIADLLLVPPMDEEVLRPVHGAGRAIPDGRAAVGGRVRRRVTVCTPAGRRTEVLLQGAGPLRVVWNRLPGFPDAPVPSWFVERLAPGSRVVFVGEKRTDEGGDVLVDAEPASGDAHHAVHLMQYGVEGVEDAAVRLLVWRFLPETERLRDPVDPAMLSRKDLPPLGQAIRDVHVYGSSKPQARRRLSFDEALLLQLGLATPRFQAARERGFAHSLVHGLAARVCQYAELVPDDEQQLALEEIKRDLRQSTPMQRVLTGKAGAGKAMVALLTTVLVAESKSQVLFLAPEQVSAEMRYLFLEPLLREVGLVGRLVTGDPTRAQRDAIRRGEVHVIFGSLDLLEREVEFRRLGLVIAEERAQYGFAPARVAAMRAPRPDLLVLASTPVPTAVLLSAYGDLDLSVIDGQLRPVSVDILEDAQREEAYRRVNAALDGGRQALVFFPMARQQADASPVEGEDGGAAEPTVVDAIDLRTARQVVEALEAEVFPGRRVGLFHGSLPRDDRYKVYDDLRHRRLDVLVATTQLEHAPPLDSVTMAVVEQADRMSMTRLQRVRGQVARGIVDGELLLVTGQSPDPVGLERLQKVESEPDGWAIAEWELAERGLEEMLAREVPGAARLRWLDAGTDRDLLLLAREQAHAMLEADPSLRRGSYGDIGRVLRERWDELLSAPCPLPEGAPSSGGGGQKRRRRRRKRK